MYNADMPTRAELPSAQKLLRSTAIAAGVATVLLFTVVLPSEYGVDPTGAGRLLGLKKMGEIKVQLAQEAQREQVSPPQQSASAASISTPPGTAENQERKDEVTLTLKPGEGTEIKLAMEKGATVRYEWTSTGGPVNHDTHGDGAGQSHRYKKELQVNGDKGDLTAIFTGKHGWFWRNRNATDVSVTLRCSGAYQALKRMP